MERMKNLLIILFISIIVINIVPNIVWGANISDLGDLDKYAGKEMASEKFVERTNSVVRIIQVIGSIVSVAVLIVLGIKYMVGSVEEKAEYKRTLMPYLVGSVLFFAIVNITGIIYTLVRGVF